MHELISIVRRIAKENPEAVYYSSDGDCFYTRGECGNGTGCIIGQALIDMKSELKGELEEVDSHFVPMARELLTRLDLGLSGAEINWLCAVQLYQDYRNSWAESTEQANRDFQDV
jgi:hypothetical protein